MSSLSSGMNLNTVKTALDAVVYPQFDGENIPYLARATDPLVFNQSTMDRKAQIMETFKGVPFWSTRQEEEDVPSSTPRVGDQATYTALNYANSVDITKNYMDDHMHDVVVRMMMEFGEKARLTQDYNAMGIFRNGFSGTLTADGAALFSDSHTTLSGDTVDNKGTAALSVAALEAGMVALQEQKDQTGEVRGHVPQTLLVPPALFREAVAITESEREASTADNDVNWVSSKYGIVVKQSQYLGASAGGSDTAWFLLGRYHHIYRWVRQGLETTLVPWENQRNNNYIYKGEFREVYGAHTFEGAYGSDGTA